MVISVIELASKALHKNKASTRIRLFCGGDQLMKQRFNYGLGLKRASLSSIKAFFVIWRKFCHFFIFDAFCVVLAHKKAFSIF
ncbi:hypothetical protein E5P66_01555 [Helicobacter pylori]|nr:hypothetical protein E5P66_01555 [Helicobacter pylori]